MSSSSSGTQPGAEAVLQLGLPRRGIDTPLFDRSNPEYVNWLSTMKAVGLMTQKMQAVARVVSNKLRDHLFSKLSSVTLPDTEFIKHIASTPNDYFMLDDVAIDRFDVRPVQGQRLSWEIRACCRKQDSKRFFNTSINQYSSFKTVWANKLFQRCRQDSSIQDWILDDDRNNNVRVVFTCTHPLVQLINDLHRNSKPSWANLELEEALKIVLDKRGNPSFALAKLFVPDLGKQREDKKSWKDTDASFMFNFFRWLRWEHFESIQACDHELSEKFPLEAASMVHLRNSSVGHRNLVLSFEEKEKAFCECLRFVNIIPPCFNVRIEERNEWRNELLLLQRNHDIDERDEDRLREDVTAEYIQQLIHNRGHVHVLQYVQNIDGDKSEKKLPKIVLRFFDESADESVQNVVSKMCLSEDFFLSFLRADSREEFVQTLFLAQPADETNQQWSGRSDQEICDVILELMNSEIQLLQKESQLELVPGVSVNGGFIRGEFTSLYISLPVWLHGQITWSDQPGAKSHYNLPVSNADVKYLATASLYEVGRWTMKELRDRVIPQLHVLDPLGVFMRLHIAMQTVWASIPDDFQQLLARQPDTKLIVQALGGHRQKRDRR